AQLAPGYDEDIWNITPIDNELVVSPVSQLNCYPNPFNPDLTISFSIAEAVPVTLEIFNIRGKRVYRKVFHNIEAGSYNHIWHSTATTGIYFIEVTSGNQTSCRKTTLLK
ncbi:MAG: T9SS type A sorting domain-containing protein, partial [Candidatus Cloacimonetes bacterium]|nr:T9SS type A sorting domain-containing protein [Candidatus Cloacimonadota bacterium]